MVRRYSYYEETVYDLMSTLHDMWFHSDDNYPSFQAWLFFEHGIVLHEIEGVLDSVDISDEKLMLLKLSL